MMESNNKQNKQTKEMRFSWAKCRPRYQLIIIIIIFYSEHKILVLGYYKYKFSLALSSSVP